MTEPSGEPHIHHVGAFEPIEAFAKVVTNLISLVEAVEASPNAIPAREILRAAQVGVDTLHAITEFTVTGLMGQLSASVDAEAWSDHNLEDDALKASRNDEQTAEHHLELIKRVTQFVPVEVGPTDV